MGEMGNELILKSLRIKSTRLAELGFKFEYPHLEQALKKEYQT